MEKSTLGMHGVQGEFVDSLQSSGNVCVGFLPAQYTNWTRLGSNFQPLETLF